MTIQPALAEDKNLLLENIQNYILYEDLILNGSCIIYTQSLTKDNIDQHFFSILNIFRDGIEQDFVQQMKIQVVFFDGVTINLSIFDYFFNLIFWKLPLSAGDALTSYFLFFEENITKGSIKKYIDTKFLDVHRTHFENMVLNNIIDDCVYKFKYIDEFSLYLLNTINNEDTINLMNENQEFYDYIHADLSNVPIEDVKNIADKYTASAVDIIMNSDHCLADSFRGKEGINIKQFREFSVNIGSIPDGRGGVFPAIINTNFLTGGLNNHVYALMDSSKGRQAQNLSKNNVGTSGHFARLIGLNNMDTKIHPYSRYICNTKNFIEIYIKDIKMLSVYKNRWYRLKPNGIEKKTTSTPEIDNTDLIGKTILLRSPVTCASAARGEGICYRCYGDLAYTNNDINIGKIAAEILSSRLTQRLLSAKHLLESRVRKLEWSKGFNEIFEIDYNTIKIPDEFDCKKWKLIINSDEIDYEDEIDDFDYNEFIYSFDVISPNGVRTKFTNNESQKIYLSKDLNQKIRKMGNVVDNEFVIDFQNIAGSDLFVVKINNDELYVTLERIKSILNKESITRASGMTKDKLVQELVETIIEGGLSIEAVHSEVLLSNQIRKASNVLLKPEWEYPDEPYQLVTLNKALTDNPSVAVSLMYQKLNKALFYPLNFKKYKPSIIDLFYMEKPQEFMNEDIQASNIKSDKDEELINPISYS